MNIFLNSYGKKKLLLWILLFYLILSYLISFSISFLEIRFKKFNLI